MTDIANINIKVETVHLNKAVGALDEFTSSANLAEKATKKLTNATRVEEKERVSEVAEVNKSTSAINRNTAAIVKQNKVRDAARGQARRAERIATGYDPRTGQMARDLGVNRFNTANIAAQFQDIGVTAAMGMNPLTIALQQGTQLSAILNNMGSPIKGLVQAFKQLINPVALISIGITGLIAALVQMVDWSKKVDSILGFMSKNIGTITIGVLSLAASFIYLQRTAIATWLINSLSPALVGVALNISVLVAGGTKLTGVFKVLAAAIMFPVKALWALLIPFAKIAFVIAGIVGWVYVILELTGVMDILNRKLREYKELRAIKEKNDFWKETTTSIEREIGALKLEARYVGQSAVFREGMRKAMEYYNKALDKKINLTNEEIVQLIKSGMEYAKIRQEMERQEEFLQNKESFLDDLNKQNKALVFQSSLLGKTESEIEKLTHLEEMRNKASEKGLLGDKDVEKMIQDNEALYNSWINDRDALDRYNTKVNEAKSITTSFFTDMNHALIQGKSLWEAFGDSVMNVISKILDKMTTIGIDQLFAAGKASNWFGFGSTTETPNVAPVPSVRPAAITGVQALGGAWDRGVQKFATGGIVGSPTLFGARNGVGLMGEAGPEAIMPLTRGANGELGVKADGVGGSSVVVNVINNSNSKATVNQRQTQQGTEIDVVIDQLVADKLGTIGSASNTAMNTWNNRQLIVR